MSACAECPWCASRDTGPNSIVRIAVANEPIASDKHRFLLISLLLKNSNNRLVVSKRTSVSNVPASYSYGGTHRRAHVEHPWCDGRDTDPESTALIAVANEPIVSETSR